jgi:hypothetical protein
MLESLVLCYTLENEWRHAHPSLGYYLPGLSQVLEGMGSHLESFDVLLIEVSSVELYAGQRLANATDAFLKARGFHCHLDCGPCKHCDRLYRRDK